MLYEITASNVLEVASSTWSPSELDLEHYLISREESGSHILHESIFGEPLLVVSNQQRTRSNKRADILALDQFGNGVIIELKKDTAQLGVETQALQYLADFSTATGSRFIDRFATDDSELSDSIIAFVGDNVDLDEINSRQRVILVARSFDTTIFSMGEWLSSKGVAFRCITYFPTEISSQRYLSFSIAFDRSSDSLFGLGFSPNSRKPAYFWHNIARADENWWRNLVKHSQIPACFEDSPGDQGEKILKKYIPGDTIFAYAKGHGVVGYCTVGSTNRSYRLEEKGSRLDFGNGSCRHRLKVSWKRTTQKLSDGISADEVRNRFGIYHPISTSVRIDPHKAKQLAIEIDNRFQITG